MKNEKVMVNKNNEILVILDEKEIVVIQDDIGAIISEAKKLQDVDTDKNYTDADEIISRISKMLKRIDKTRKFYTDPLKEQVKKINQRYEKYSVPMLEADNVLRGKMLVFRQKQEVRRREEEVTARLEAEKIAKKENISVEEILESSDKESALESDNSTVKKIWDFEVTDFEQIPREYLVVSNTIVKNEIWAGVRKIKGIRIFQKEIISLK